MVLMSLTYVSSVPAVNKLHPPDFLVSCLRLSDVDRIVLPL